MIWFPSPFLRLLWPLGGNPEKERSWRRGKGPFLNFLGKTEKKMRALGNREPNGSHLRFVLVCLLIGSFHQPLHLSTNLPIQLLIAQPSMHPSFHVSMHPSIHLIHPSNSSVHLSDQPFFLPFTHYLSMFCSSVKSSECQKKH